MNKSTFHIKKMDCPSEESLIRMKLDSVSEIEHLAFDTPNRILDVYHSGNVQPIAQEIDSLNLDSKLVESLPDQKAPIGNSDQQKRVLRAVLIINLALFIAEMTTGIISRSMGLVADSLDMFADAIVYGLSLYAVGKAVTTKKGVARVSGYFQLSLAILGFGEIVRRFLMDGEIPVFQIMIIVSIIALVGNALCLYLLNKERSDEAHMKASWIFTTNDIVVNLGVIVAGYLVFQFNSRIPDLLVGTIVFGVVIRGAVRILKLGK